MPAPRATRLNRNNAVGLVLRHNYFTPSSKENQMTAKLPFHVRGAAYEAAAGLAHRAALGADDAERVLDAMLGILGILGEHRPDRPLLAGVAAVWPASASIETLGQHHGTVLLCGEQKPSTYRVGYRDLEGTVRLADHGEAAPWATQWWPLP